jgi:glycosyltransferase involved in cell wall biosynthesis
MSDSLDQVRVSVVIPAYNAAATLAGTLHALAAQDLPAPRVEVVVVDDGSADATADLVEQFAGSAAIAVTLLRQSNQGPAAARNAGVRRARGDVIAFLDADAYPALDWLRKGLAYFDAPGGPDLLEGPITVAHPERMTAFTHHLVRDHGGGFVTCNMWYRRRAFDALGGFDEAFRTNFFEDSDLGFRALDRGLVAHFAPDVVVTHEVFPPKLLRPLHEQRRHFYHALIYRKHPARYRERVAPLMKAIPQPFADYALVSLLLPIAAASRSLAMVASAALLWAYFFRRVAFTLRLNPRNPRDLPGIPVIALVPLARIYWVLRGNLRWRTWIS